MAVPKPQKLDMVVAVSRQDRVYKDYTQVTSSLHLFFSIILLCICRLWYEMTGKGCTWM